MCGIVGAFSFGKQAKPIDTSSVARLNDMQRRRGPDGEGIWASDENRVVLGHRRLAIIETGDAGAQPMSDATGRWVITFNGEIYNYSALRAELESLGNVFSTNSDTEVLINTVAQWGEAGLKKLRGMFTFALWDKLQQELWLVRDPYGIKPLYVAITNGTIWFASQARTLASLASVDTQRDPAAVVGLYLWGHVPEPFSWWQGIEVFPAGHVQRIRSGSVPASLPKAYYCIQEAFVCHQAEPLIPGQLREVMLGSVRHHLVADVPVGIFLSAGVDSTVVAALATELKTKLKTITLAFDEYKGTPFDEAPAAESIAKQLNSDHTTVRISRPDFESLLDDFLNCMDVPTIDGLNMYLVSRAAAAQGLKVALSGVGGDELFGGYASFRQIPKLLRFHRYFSSLGLGRQRKYKYATSISRAFRINPKFVGILKYGDSITSAYLLRRSLMLEEELDTVLDESWINEGIERLSTVEALNRTLDADYLNDASDHMEIALLESCWYMRNQLLRDGDWASMAWGLELRMPYVDVDVLKNLSPAIASNRPPNKEELSNCSIFSLSESARRPKTGFATPLREWTTGSRGNPSIGLRGWASNLHRHFRKIPKQSLSAAIS